MTDSSTEKLTEHELRMQSALSLRAIPDYQGAYVQLRKAVKLAPNDARLWLLLGLTCMDLGSLDDAARHLRRAVRIDPDLKEASRALLSCERRRTVLSSMDWEQGRSEDEDGPKRFSANMSLLIEMTSRGHLSASELDDLLQELVRARQFRERDQILDVALAGKYELSARLWFRRAQAKYYFWNPDRDITAKRKPVAEEYPIPWEYGQIFDDFPGILDRPFAHIDVASEFVDDYIRPLENAIERGASLRLVRLWISVHDGYPIHRYQAICDFGQRFRDAAALRILAALDVLRGTKDDYEGAEYYCQNAIEAADADPRSHALLGHVRLAMGSEAEALESFEQASRCIRRRQTIDRRHAAELYAGWAQAYVRVHGIHQMVELVLARGHRYAYVPELCQAAFRACVRQGRTDLTEKLVTYMTSHGISDVTSLYVHQIQLAETDERFTNSMALYSAAAQLYRAGQYSHALSALDRLTSIPVCDPSLLSCVWSDRALLLMSLGRWEEAERSIANTCCDEEDAQPPSPELAVWLRRANALRAYVALMTDQPSKCISIVDRELSRCVVTADLLLPLPRFSDGRLDRTISSMLPKSTTDLTRALIAYKAAALLISGRAEVAANWTRRRLGTDRSSTFFSLLTAAYAQLGDTVQSEEMRTKAEDAQLQEDGQLILGSRWMIDDPVWLNDTNNMDSVICPATFLLDNHRVVQHTFNMALPAWKETDVDGWTDPRH